jgi:hypothetical protein
MEGASMREKSQNVQNKTSVFSRGHRPALFAFIGLLAISALSFSFAFGQASWTYANGSVANKVADVTASIAPWQFNRNSYPYTSNDINGGWYDASGNQTASLSWSGTFHNVSTGIGWFSDAKRNDYYTFDGFSSFNSAPTLVMPWTGEDLGTDDTWGGSPVLSSLAHASYNNTSVKNLVFPVFYHDIATTSFAGFHGLETLVFNPTYTITQALYLLSDHIGLHKWPYQGRGDLFENSTYAKTVTIASQAFYNCETLQYVDLPSNLASIGSQAFAVDASLNAAPVLQLNYAGTTASLRLKIGTGCFKGHQRVILVNTTNSGDRLVMNATDGAYSTYFN